MGPVYYLEKHSSNRKETQYKPCGTPCQATKNKVGPVNYPAKHFKVKDTVQTL